MRFEEITVDQFHHGCDVALGEDVGANLADEKIVALPRRWVVERTLERLGRCRRLSKGYEALLEFSEAWAVAMIHRPVGCLFRGVL